MQDGEKLLIPAFLFDRRDLSISKPNTALKTFIQDRALDIQDLLNVLQEETRKIGGLPKEGWYTISETKLYFDFQEIVSTEDNCTFVTVGCKTAEKLTVQNIQELNDFLFFTIDTAKERIFCKDLQHRYIFTNDKFAHDAGYDKKTDLIGLTDYDCAWKKEEADFFVQCDKEVFESGTAQIDIDEPQQQAHGKVHWLRTSKYPLRAPDGTLMGLLGRYTDVTEEQERKKEFLEQKAFLENLFNSLPVALIVKNIDNDFRIEKVNNHFTDLFGQSPEEVIGKNDFDAFPRELAEHYRKCDIETIEKGHLQIEEEKIMAKDGERFARTGKFALYDEVGLPKKLVVMIQDITEIKESIVRTEEANRAKSEFLANMSHEIRTPMNGVLGFAELLLESSPREDQRSYLKAIEASARSLLHLINEILDLSHIESGKLAITNKTFSPHILAQSIELICAHRAELNDIEFGIFLDEEVEDAFISDETRLRQILVNLVGNAIKFTPKGGSVIVYITQGESADDNLRFYIIDSGIGIAKKNQRAVLEAFTQADASISRKYGGSGLGLNITKSLLKLMGSELVLRSEKGIGTCFTFEIEPQAETQGSEESTAAEEHTLSLLSSQQQLRILVAEDNQVNQKLIESILTNKGHKITMAKNGREAIAEYASGEFDLILMDIQMPEIDGLQAMREIRSRETGTGNKIPIIALTAHAMKGDAEMCFEAGADEYVTKPIHKKNLFEAIKNLTVK